jgi:nucleoside-diphosphate-sugar epimerase
VVETLLNRGYANLRCLVRPSSNLARLEHTKCAHPEARVEVMRGNLLVPSDCHQAVDGVRVIYHIAAGRDKTFAGCFADSVVATRNLLEEARRSEQLVRFVSISSFAVYSNYRMRRGAVLDESCPLEDEPQRRFEPYTYAKLKQDEIVMTYGRDYRVPYVIIRPGNVFGPGKRELPGRIGIDTFGVFLHLGGSNLIPFTFVENCAEAIVLAGIKRGVDGEVFNVVDDDLPRSRHFLHLYKKNVGAFRSIWVPYRIWSLLCRLWEWYSQRSGGQIPPAFNARSCSAFWKGNRYSNTKIKTMLGWSPRIQFCQAALCYFDSVRRGNTQ